MAVKLSTAVISIREEERCISDLFDTNLVGITILREIQPDGDCGTVFEGIKYMLLQ